MERGGFIYFIIFSSIKIENSPWCAVQMGSVVSLIKNKYTDNFSFKKTVSVFYHLYSGYCVPIIILYKIGSQTPAAHY